MFFDILFSLKYCKYSSIIFWYQNLLWNNKELAFCFPYGDDLLILYFLGTLSLNLNSVNSSQYYWINSLNHLFSIPFEFTIQFFIYFTYPTGTYFLFYCSVLSRILVMHMLDVLCLPSFYHMLSKHCISLLLFILDFGNFPQENLLSHRLCFQQYLYILCFTDSNMFSEHCHVLP